MRSALSIQTLDRVALALNADGQKIARFSFNLSTLPSIGLKLGAPLESKSEKAQAPAIYLTVTASSERSVSLSRLAALLVNQHFPSGLVIPGGQRVEIQTACHALAKIVPAIPVDCLIATFVGPRHTMPQINRANRAPVAVIDAQPDRSVGCQTVRDPRFGVERVGGSSVTRLSYPGLFLQASTLPRVVLAFLCLFERFPLYC